MKTLAVCALALLLVSPALARPNLIEPIYLRRRSNPLEIVEESVESSTLNQVGAAQSSTEQQQQASSGTTTETTGSSSSTTTTGSSAGVKGGSTTGTSTHQPSHLLKRPEQLKTKIGTSGFVVSTSTKVLTGGASAASGHSSLKMRPGEAKATDQLTLFDRHAGHAGVAEPMTDEEVQSELHRHAGTERVPPRTTTPREGLSTWVLLSGSDSSELQGESTSTTRKAPLMKASTTTTTTTSTVAPMTTTTSATVKPTTPVKRFQPATRRVMQTTTARPARTTTVAASSSEEKKEQKVNKPTPKLKTITTTLKPVILKKVKKPVAVPTTAAPTTTTPSSTTTTTTTTTEMVITEQSPSTVASDVAPVVATEDSSAESSTFLIMEPKDAQFDLPEDRSPGKTAPAAATKAKKPTRKTNVKSPAGGKKKPGVKKRKPEVKDVLTSDKKPANKNKPVSTQIINYLSREVMPTVGVGIVGLMMAAGLASYFLGSPLGALRRSDDRKDDLYYSNYEEYAGQDGQNEEDVFGKLIAGMPDRAYYRNNAVRRRNQQPVRTGHQYYHVQPYSANKYPHISYRNRAYAGPSAPEPMYTNINRQAQVPLQGPAQVAQAKAQNEFYYNTPPTPYYPTRAASVEAATRPPAPVYSSVVVTATSTSTSTASPATEAVADPIGEPEPEMMPHPEAYSAEHSPEHHAHYVVGSSYSDGMLDMINSVPEHGPRRKRAAAEDEDDELANEIDVDEDRPKDEVPVVVMVVASTSGESATTATTATDSMEEFDPTTTTSTATNTTTAAVDGQRYTWGDFIRNTVERKVAMGIHFLQHVTTDFQRYLHGVQNRFQHPHDAPTDH